MTEFWHALRRLYASSIGKKFIVALTGLVMVGFLIGHLAGNLLIFAGDEAINAYGVRLREFGPMLWVARLGLLAAVAAHIVATVHLTAQNRRARPDGYVERHWLRATLSSRTMMWTGVTIVVFVIYHLMHFTWGSFNQFYVEGGPYYLADGRHNIHRMVIDGFRQPLNTLFYVVAIGLLCMHLTHGFASVFQTLGLTNTRSSRQMFGVLSWGFSILLFVGYVSIPAAVVLGVLTY